MSGEAGIQAIKRSLGLSEREEELVRAAAPRLLPEVEGWVERFYARLVSDPAAARILKDDAVVIRLKRSLVAWFHEMFSLPYDETYARVRATIGDAHVRIGMPEHLMVAAMAGVRGDLADAVRAAFDDDPRLARETARALGLVLDLELSLMLSAYRRRAREVDRAAATDVSAARVAHRFAHATRDGLDAALCYAELLRRAGSETQHERWAVRLEETLRQVARLDRRGGGSLLETPSRREAVAVADLCARALSEARLPPEATTAVEADPPGLVVRLHALPVALALEEMLADAAGRDPSGRIRLVARAGAEGAVTFEVTHQGASGLPRREGGTGLAAAEYAADLHGGEIEPFVAPGGVAGLRLHLAPGTLAPGDEAERTDHADLDQGPRREPS